MPITVAKKTGRPRVYKSESDKQAAYLKRAGKVQCNVTLPADVAKALDAYVARSARDGSALTKSETVAKLLRTQLLRKR